MDVNILFGLNYLLLEEPEYKYKDFYLTSDGTILAHEFSQPEFLQSMGRIAIDAIKESSMIGYIFGSYSIKDPKKFDREVLEVVTSLDSEFKTFIERLWIVKDNSINIHSSFACVSERKGGLALRWLHEYSMAGGGRSDVKFSAAEIDKAVEIMNKLSELSVTVTRKDAQKGDIAPIGYIDSDQNLALYNSYSRIQRAVYFIMQARQSSFLPNKLAAYVNGFEVLFSQKEEGIAHQLSFRIATYIGGTTDEKTKIYDTVKNAYNVRSSLYHGSKIDFKSSNSDKGKGISELSLQVDNLMRIIMQKVIFGRFEYLPKERFE